MGTEVKDFSFFVSTKIIIGNNSVSRIGTEARGLIKNGKNILIVTDKDIEKAGLVKRVEEPLEDENFEVDIFNGVEAEPHLEIAESLTKIIRFKKYNLIIGLGGGSSMDIAKIGSAMATNPGSPKKYLGNNKLKKKGIPKILIPTTAGTGSEVSRGAVVTVGEEKKVVSDTRYGFADLAIVDGTMGLSIPKRVTASSGFDALSHAIESFISRSSNPISETLAIKAIELIAGNLRIAYTNGMNLLARYNLSLASLLAGISFENSGMTSSHPVAEILGPMLKIPHGVALSVVLPAFLEYFEVGSVDKFKIIAKLMGENIAGVSSYNSAIKAVEAVKKLRKDIDLPTSLEELQAEKDDIRTLVNRSSKIIESFSNIYWDPRKITIKDLTNIFDKM